MTKRTPPQTLSKRHSFRLGWKLVVLVSVGLCVIGLLKLQSELAAPPARGSRRIRADAFVGSPKVAFLFLARRDLPLDFLWQAFFENADVANFSIYIHSEPGFVFDESSTRSAFFYNRQLRNSIKVGWGESSMIGAERLLLEAALDDPANRRFVLLSDRLRTKNFAVIEYADSLSLPSTAQLYLNVTILKCRNSVSAIAKQLGSSILHQFWFGLCSCVPLYNFSYIYNYLMASPRSFVDSFLDKKEGRYNPKMSYAIRKKKWRKGSQWITLIRRHAEVVADDDVIFPAFKKFCKHLCLIMFSYNATFLSNEEMTAAVRSDVNPRRPPIDASKGKQNSKRQKQHNCIPDEHYVQTLFAINDLEGELERRTVTYTLWNESATKLETKGWHPVTFNYANAGPQQIKKIKDINHVYYETEFRTEWCSNNSTPVPCFLFARKFSKGAAMRLLSEGVVGSFDASALLQTQT
ncbi:hypothetical protein RJ639_023027 [Escallonia herrerae]|uniref:Core-2/I-branching beta-1,6-N-acetylglucosaminyltransferase family protein n=1 Tax=Escallonia herrerae TaxID=1293975 RepID=A0AA89ADQ2_9ASTE|nr:hypothetical protein RJ639_023027 [Escallonia herrerae]